MAKTNIKVDALMLKSKPGMYTAIVVHGKKYGNLGVYGRSREAAIQAGISWVKNNGLQATIDRVITHTVMA